MEDARFLRNAYIELTMYASVHPRSLETTLYSPFKGAY